MAKICIPAAAALVAIVSLGLPGCEAIRGANEVDTSPREEGVGKHPGLLTGKKGALIIETEPWEGASPFGDSEE